MIQVVPAIIPHTREQFEEEVRKVASFVPLIQVDICDGIFVSTKTWPYNGRDVDFFNDLKNERVGWPKWEEVEVELHLMVKNPESVLSDWLRTGIGTVIAHIEATDNFQKIIDTCRESHVSVGIAIKPSTDIARLKPFVPQVNFIQVMGSDHLGKHGTPLEDKALLQIKRLREEYPNSIIAIDIGVNGETKSELVSAGATKLVSGGDILNAVNPGEEYKELSQ